MNIIHSALDTLRDRYAPISHNSTFRNTGQITPEEFILAGDYLNLKFPTWSWADASSATKRVNYLPVGKQFLVTRGVPSHKRLIEVEDFSGGAADDLVRDGFLGGPEGESPGAGGEDEGWLRTGGSSEKEQGRLRGEVKTMSESGDLGKAEEDEDEIPDMEDEDDDQEAIIRDNKNADGSSSHTRTYNLYITYTPYYRTPRFYLSGYLSPSEPLSPPLMMEDIVGDYKDKTVTLEDFPFYDNAVKMASVHPCKHASVMKVLLDRADAAMKLRLQNQRQGKESGVTGMEGLIDDTKNMNLDAKRGYEEGAKAAAGGQGDEWEVLDQDEGAGEEKVAIRVDQYLVVFLKFMASVTPGIEYDNTMKI